MKGTQREGCRRGRRALLAIAGSVLVPLFAEGWSQEGPPEAPSDLMVVNGNAKDPAARERDLAEVAGMAKWRNLLGSPVNNEEGRRVGSVKDFLVELESGKIGFVELEVGRVGEIGWIVPIDRLRWSRDVSKPVDDRVGVPDYVLLTDDGQAGGELRSSAQEMELLRSRGYRALSELERHVMESVRGSNLEFVECLIDFDRDLAVVMEVRMRPGSPVDRVDASVLDWTNLK